MRFWSTITDLGITAYVNKIDFDRDTCFGVYKSGELIAFAHLGFVDETTYELGISVSDDQKGSGLGKLVMQRIITWCKANNVSKLIIECLRDNQAMRGLSKKLGLRLVVDEESALAEVAMHVHYSERLAEIQKNLIYENIALVDSTVREFHDSIKKWF
jgi:acetyltransferase